MGKHLRSTNGRVDAVDARLLEVLATDARTSHAELGRRVGLSAPSVTERVRRLEEAGVITGYAATIDPAALGYALAVWIRVRPVPGKMQEVAATLAEIAEITSCDRVTGEDCFIARASIESVDRLGEVLDRIVPIAMTHTAIVQSSPVGTRLPPIRGSS